MRKVISFILLILATGVSPLFSEEEDIFNLGEIVITATTVPHLLKDTPGTVTVVTEEEIKEKNIQDVGDILENVAGVRITRYGSLGAESSVSLRGLYAAHTLILIDGRPINQPQSGSASLSQLSPDNIERIEVVRGPFSSLYGSGAVGGVVNIITKTPPEEFKTTLYTSYGSWNTWITRLEHGGTVERLSYLLNGEYRTSDGERDNSFNHAKDLALKLEYPLEDGKIYFKAGHNSGKTGVPGPEPSDDENKRSLSQKIYGNDEVSSTEDYQEHRDQYIDIGGEWKNLKLKIYENSWDLDWHQWYAVSSGWPPVTHHHKLISKHRTISRAVSLQSNWELYPANRLTIGLSYRNDIYDNESRDKDEEASTVARSTIEESRYTQSIFLEDEIIVEPLTVTLGGRWDNPSDYDSQFSPKINLLWNLTDKSRLRASWGKAYRAPSLQDLYWPSDPFTQGNEDLKAEKTTSYELGWEQEWNERVLSRLTYFQQEVKDMIQWAPTGPPGLYGPKWWPDNIGRVKTQGLEAEVKVAFTENINSTICWTHFFKATQKRDEIVNGFTSEMEEKKRDAIYTPENKVDLTFTHKNLFGIGAEFNLNAQYVSKVKNYYTDWDHMNPVTGAVPTEEKKLSAYTVVNVKVSKNIRNWEVFLAVDNLFDENYATRFGYDLDDNDYPMPGRSVTIGGKVEF